MSENGFGSNGDSPTPEQYRRRRIVAGLIAALVLLALIWGMVALVGAIRGTGQDTSAAASATATSAPFSDFSARPTVEESATSEATESAAAEETDSAAAEATETATPEATETAEPTAAATETATPEASETATPEASETATPEATETPGVVAACNASNLKVSITTDQAAYTAGAYPAIAVTYTNTSGTPCNVGGDVQSIDVNITSGIAQVYNSSQCQVDVQPESELAAGNSGTVVMTWGRQLNALGCANPIAIQPGYYWATATVNGVASTPVGIIING